MIVTCKVIEDLLPLYADGICSEDTKTVVEHHTAECADCRKKLEAMTSDTMETEKIRTEKPSPENPFKKVRNHYIKLVTVTLLACLLLIVPLGGAWYLKTTEIYNTGYSWATVRTANKLKKIGNLMKSGKYRKALDLFEPFCESSDYTDAEIEAFKDQYAEVFENCFDDNSIKTVSCYAEDGKSERGYIHFSISNDNMKENRMETFTMVFGYDTKGRLKFIEYKDNNMGIAVPNMQLPAKNTAENYFDALKYGGDLRHFSYYLYTEERALSQWDGTEFDNSDWGRTVVKNEERLKELLENYRYIGCESGEIRFGHNDPSLSEYYQKYYYLDIFKIWNQYLQKTTLTMATKDGEQFTVEFDLPIYTLVGYLSNVSLNPLFSHEYAELWNIAYSDNTPDDFKTKFEEIFA